MLIREMLDGRTMLVMGSTLLMAGVAMIPAGHRILLGYLYYRCLYFAEALFHEMGHAITSWLFGGFAIPSLMTLFGSDQAAGVTAYMGAMHWPLQLLILSMFGGWLYRRYAEQPFLLSACIMGLVLLFLLSFTDYPEILRTYMGHGGSLLAAGWLLYRGWTNAYMRSEAERWLNGLVGWFIIIDNAGFAWALRRDAAFRDSYQGQTAFGHNDFVNLAEITSYNVAQWAMLHLVVCALTALGSFFLAAYFYGDERHLNG